MPLICVAINGNRTKRVLSTINSSSQIVNATITFRNQKNQETNPASGCHIDSLGVYRGKRQVNNIDHNGFSIINEKNIQVKISSVPLSCPKSLSSSLLFLVCSD